MSGPKFKGDKRFTDQFRVVPTGKLIAPGDYYQPLFDHMHEHHDLILLQTEMDEIIDVVNDLGEHIDRDWETSCLL